MSFLDRALKTYQLLRGLRVFIDIADDELLELSRQRDDAQALGESLRNSNLISQHSTERLLPRP